MRRASLFVHPSPRETFGVVAVEALAAGLPVVATDSGGVTEILGDEPERLGALVAADDPAALAAAILETLGRGSDFDPQVLRGSIERRFGRQFVAERLLVAYRDALATRSTPRTRPADPLVGATSEPQSGSSRMPSLLVALDRARAAVRLAGLPASLREALVVVTAIEPATARLPAVGRLVELDIDVHWRVPVAALPTGVPAPVGRLLRLAKDPIGTFRRRAGLDTGSERSLEPATRVIERLVEPAATGAGVGSVVVALDGHDHLAVASLVASGRVQLYPGGLRRLADASLAVSGDAGPVPPTDAAETRGPEATD
jgi:hypothetical protein